MRAVGSALGAYTSARCFVRMLLAERRHAFWGFAAPNGEGEMNAQANPFIWPSFRSLATPRWSAARGLLVVAVALAGCGKSKGDRSVEACEYWLSTMECGETDYRDSFDCSIYAEQRCDVSPYFACLTVNTECDEEASTFDLSGWEQCKAQAGCSDD